MSSLQVNWYGHSNVMLIENGVSVLVDPFFEGNPFAPDWRDIPKPNIIAVTHDHGDHLGQAMEIARTTGAVIACIADLADWFRGQGIPASQIVNHGSGWNIDGTVEHAGVRLTMTQAFHSARHGAPVGFVIEMPGGHTVYHAGDTGLFGDMALIADRFALDLALLPIGGVFTMDPALAVKAAKLLKPSAVMPIHYKTFPLLEQDANSFVESMGQHMPSCRVLTPAPCELIYLD